MSDPETALTPERLHARYAARIDRCVRAVVGRDDEREDMVQEVLLTVFRSVGALRNPACMDGWVNQVTLNTLRYHMRRRRLRQHAPWDGLLEHQIPSSFQVNPDARELASRVMGVLDRLPPNDRALLSGYWFSPATAGSIAAETGCSPITVRRRLLKARARFEKLARRDPALAACIDEARLSTRRWRYAACDAGGRHAGSIALEVEGTPSAA